MAAWKKRRGTSATEPGSRPTVLNMRDKKGTGHWKCQWNKCWTQLCTLLKGTFGNYSVSICFSRISLNVATSIFHQILELYIQFMTLSKDYCRLDVQPRSNVQPLWWSDTESSSVTVHDRGAQYDRLKPGWRNMHYVTTGTSVPWKLLWNMLTVPPCCYFYSSVSSDTKKIARTISLSDTSKEISWNCWTMTTFVCDVILFEGHLLLQGYSLSTCKWICRLINFLSILESFTWFYSIIWGQCQENMGFWPGYFHLSLVTRKNRNTEM